MLSLAASRTKCPNKISLSFSKCCLHCPGFNTLLRYMQPLIITLGCNVEPLIGSMLGWAVGVMAAPGAWTYVGGVLVMVSTVQVTVAAHFRLVLCTMHKSCCNLHMHSQHAMHMLLQMLLFKACWAQGLWQSISYPTHA